VSRSRPSWLATVLGDAYTLHFWPPYGDPEVQQAKHYTGWAEEGRLRQRLVDHARGRGARLTQVQREAGGSWVLAGVEQGVTRDRETQLKERGASRRCSVCRAERDVETGRVTREQALERAGWDRATDYERGLLLEIFGLEAAPPNLAVREYQPDPEPIEQHWPGAPTPEQQAEMDVLVDRLCAQWRAEADAVAGTAGLETQAEPGPEPEPELEASA
jgi:predicted GIY-YIG superfamily endonuclease